MAPDLIIFDCDGVLVDSEPITHAVIAENLTSRGLAMTPRESVAFFIGGTMLDVQSKARDLGANLPPDWIDEIYQQMFARLEKGVPLISGIVNLIELAEARGIALAVASNGPMEKMRRTLGPSGLWSRLSPYIYSRDNHAAKPAPDMVYHAMKVAGTQAHRTVMIDDSQSGCLAARNAGVRCIGYAAEGQDQDLAAVGAEPLNTMAQIALALDLGA